MFKIRAGRDSDIDAIIRLYESSLNRPANRGFITTSIENYPVFIAMMDDELIGFVYCRRFSPDILEPANVLVQREHRSKKVGEMLMRAVEDAARSDYAALILVNSTLHSEAADKRDASSFYIRLGYEKILQTNGSKVFAKELK